jgi:hypothetical protein
VSTLAFPKPKDMPKLPPAAVLYPGRRRRARSLQHEVGGGRAEYERRKDVMYAAPEECAARCAAT